MADALGIETRSRSRSKTPGLLFSENGDSDKKGSKKIPTISLIEEENDVIEIVPSSQTSQPSQTVRPKRQRRSAKAADTSADVSIESLKNSQKDGSSKETTVTTTTTVTTSTVKKTINGSEEASTNITKPNDESQSIFNNIFNAIKTSTPILSNKRSKRITQDTAVNVADHPAYKEYKDAGEYWNKYPKTDYTYSELSPHRRELSNGVVAMPNMSRRSLEKYQNRVENMIQNNPTEESFLRRKFLSNVSSSFQKRSADLQYDSADEVDVSELRRQLQTRRKPSDNIVSRFFLSIVTYMYSAYYSSKQGVRRVFYGSNQRYVYTPVRRQQAGEIWEGFAASNGSLNEGFLGIFSRTFESIKKFVLLGFSKLYLLVSTVLCLDTWILYTRSENVVANRKRKRFLLLLLLLLPLLLLAGEYKTLISLHAPKKIGTESQQEKFLSHFILFFAGTLIYLDPPKNFSFPKLSFPKLRLPKISLPKLSLPTISLPSFPQISWPSFSFTLPTFSLAWPAWLTLSWLKFPDLSFSWPAWSFSWPDWSFSWPAWSFSWPSWSWPAWLALPAISFEWLKFSRPEWLKFPDFSLPDFSLPTISWPNITLPSLPQFSLPSLPSFSFDVSPYTGYVGEKLVLLKSSSVEIFDKIREATFGLLNEAQIVWNENFNTISNAN